MLQHIAFIMDGNGRWAQKRGLERTAGHAEGSQAVRRVLDACQKKGIHYVTLFAFSSENWKRPAAEVAFLMKLFRKYLNEDVRELQKHHIRVSFIGEKERFPKDIQSKMLEIETQTASFEKFHVILALGYGSRWDLAQAARKIAEKVVVGQLTLTDISEKTVSDSLSTTGIPDPDLIIRTSGEARLSNFLLWESAYTEFYFTPVFWPDFDEKELDKALEDYASRHRRFGQI